MFKKILIANRGEIACRIIKTARNLGIHTVAVYADADRDSLHVAMADEAVHIGAAPSRESYLIGEKILAAALKTGAEAIHPGYGFLAENAAFCRLCDDNGLSFIGPPAAAIESMGSKSAAKRVMESVGVPLLPGYHGDDQREEVLRQAADSLGYPVLLKAVAGGGGKGMRQVWKGEDFTSALAGARREARASFGNDDMLVEKYLTRPRHVEIQLFCDGHGGAVYLFERDCSVQRRHQKIIEEAPAPGMTDVLRQEMGEAALRAAQAIQYQGAGTVEFLLDQDGAFYFMEMNTRLQVEHPVTEMITGQDLVAWQIRIAAGEPLPLRQAQLRRNGHAFEARIYAEDPDNGFLPESGTLTYLQPPAENEHVRVDTGVLQGDKVSIYYDPMIAKLIVWDESRGRALTRLARALSEYRISGMKTNIEFLYNLATCEPFMNGDLDTGFIERHHDLLFRSRERDLAKDLPLASLYLLLRREQMFAARASATDPYSPWNRPNGWRLNGPHIHPGAIILNGKYYDVPVEETGSGENRRFIITAAGNRVMATGELVGNELYSDIDGHRLRATVVPHDDKFSLFSQDGAMQFTLAQPDYGEDEAEQVEGGFTAPMNGTVIAIVVKPGEPVERGDPLLIMETMKMEQTICATSGGKVLEFYYQEGDLVDGGAQLLKFESAN